MEKQTANTYKNENKMNGTKAHVLNMYNWQMTEAKIEARENLSCKKSI